MEKEVKRGDVFFVTENEMKIKAPHEQAGERPAIVISNDIGNLFSPTVIVVYLTSQLKKMMPTHVCIAGLKKPSTALCEQIETVSKERLDNRIYRLSENEMQKIDKAISISLGIGGMKSETV